MVGLGPGSKATVEAQTIKAKIRRATHTHFVVCDAREPYARDRRADLDKVDTSRLRNHEQVSFVLSIYITYIA